MPSSKGDIYWAAGLFEGEGCFSRNHKSLSVQINMTDKDVLDKFHSIVGVGSVKGPYRGQNSTNQKAHHKLLWVYKVSSFQEVQYIMAMFYSLLGERRKAKIEENLKWYKEHHAVK